MSSEKLNGHVAMTGALEVGVKIREDLERAQLDSLPEPEMVQKIIINLKNQAPAL